MSSLLISCVGAYGDSGIGTGGFVLYHNEKIFIIDNIDTTGLSFHNDRIYRFVRMSKSLVGYDKTGKVYDVRFNYVNDCHDILMRKNDIVLVSTNSNEVYFANYRGDIIKTWKAPGSGDAWHLNCLYEHNDELYISAFGKFERNRQWNEEGAIDQGIIYNIDQEKVIARGLSGPHHPRFIDNQWYICDSHKKSFVSISDDGNVERTLDLGGFTRGVHVGDSYIFVGVNANRKDPNAQNSKIVLIDRKTVTESGAISIPFPEIYDIIECSHELAESIAENIDKFSYSQTDDNLSKGLQNQVQLTEKKVNELEIINEKLRTRLKNSNPRLINRIINKLKK